MSIENNHKQFKQWWSKAKNTLKCDEYDAFEIWLASASRDGYKLVPVVDTDAMWSAGRAVIEENGYSTDASDVYKAMIGAVE